MITLFVKRRIWKESQSKLFAGLVFEYLSVLLKFCSCLHCAVSPLIKEIKCRLARINLVLLLQSWFQNENKLFPRTQDITDTDGPHCIGSSMFLNKKTSFISELKPFLMK